MVTVQNYWLNLIMGVFGSSIFPCICLPQMDGELPREARNAQDIHALQIANYLFYIECLLQSLHSTMPTQQITYY